MKIMVRSKHILVSTKAIPLPHLKIFSSHICPTKEGLISCSILLIFQIGNTMSVTALIISQRPFWKGLSPAVVQTRSLHNRLYTE